MSTLKIVSSIYNMNFPRFDRVVHRNPSLSYRPTAPAIDLPRFITENMREARVMNQAVLTQLKSSKKKNAFPKASNADLKILTDKTYTASFQKTVWVNPKNGKSYHLINSGSDKNGRIIVRILDKDGGFVKEIPIKKKKILVFEPESNECSKTLNMRHSDLMSLFVKRYNPFADVKVCFWHDKLNLSKEVLKEIDKDTAAISCAFQNAESIIPKNKISKFYYEFFNKRVKVTPKHLFESLKQNLDSEIKEFSVIPQHVRVFMAAGNYGKNSYNRYLVLKNVEGVGSLDCRGKVADFSGSRNSYFTQHYELGEFPVLQTPDGYSFTGTNDIDIPLKSDKFRLLEATLRGSSISVSIRAAKAVLNQMMENIL